MGKVLLAIMNENAYRNSDTKMTLMIGLSITVKMLRKKYVQNELINASMLNVYLDLYDCSENKILLYNNGLEN